MIRDIGRFHLLLVVAYQWPGPPNKEGLDLASPMEQTAGPEWQPTEPRLVRMIHNVTYDGHIVQPAVLHRRYNTTEWGSPDLDAGNSTCSHAHTHAKTEGPLASYALIETDTY